MQQEARPRRKNRVLPHVPSNGLHVGRNRLQDYLSRACESLPEIDSGTSPPLQNRPRRLRAFQITPAHQQNGFAAVAVEGLL